MKDTMFEKDFYPTPVEVIGQMLTGHDVAGKIVLEPSAGSGNIVDYLQRTMHFEFVNDSDWELFNRRVGEIRGWSVGSRRERKRKKAA